MAGNSNIENVLQRNVESVIDKESFIKKLGSGRKLRIKHGIDPTGDKIHFGRAVVLSKLSDLQKLGHKVILIIGDFTAQIGDPSDKLEKRPTLSKAQVRKNLKNYLPQIGKIIDLRKAEVHYNSKWLSRLKFSELLTLADIFTVQQMLERRNFKERVESDKEIGLRELFYPIMQGYDSVAVRADLEIGGADQLFNLLAGRKIQEFYGKKPQDILTTKMLLGTDGRKMSTSWGNVINIADSPRDMFGKIMALKDDLIRNYFMLATDLEESEIDGAMQLPPIDAKERLAFEVTRRYHSQILAEGAKKFFKEAFREKKLPSEISLVKFNDAKLSEILLRENLVGSNSDFRRLIRSGAIEVDSKIISDPNFRPGRGAAIKVGKKKFLKVE